jgi:hypothetical protein
MRYFASGLTNNNMADKLDYDDETSIDLLAENDDYIPMP